jgi:serine phosphatase RsbU (regulator of sigma subunit)
MAIFRIVSREDFESRLAPGENLFFYSDGLVEAHNPAGEMSVWLSPPPGVVECIR